MKATLLTRIEKLEEMQRQILRNQDKIYIILEMLIHRLKVLKEKEKHANTSL